MALGSFSISAIKHVFGTRAISGQELLFNSSNWRAPTSPASFRALELSAMALSRFQPSRVMEVSVARALKISFPIRQLGVVPARQESHQGAWEVCSM